LKSGPSIHERWRCSWFGLLAGAVIVSWVSIFLGISQGSGAVIPENRSTWFVDMNRFTRAAHAGLRCEDCHGTMMEGTQKHPEPVELRQEATRVYDYSRCKSCHLKAYERYGLGGHAKVLREQTAARATGLPIPTDPKAHAPTCGHCHSSHYDRSGLSRLDTGIRQVLTCGSCHPAHAQSYLEDRHGRVGIHLEGANAAYCSDCHGAHTVVSLREKDKALSACRRCHPEAEALFTDFVVHASLKTVPVKGTTEDAARQKTRVLLHRIKVIAALVVGLTLALFFAHNFLWVLRELHEKLRKR